MQNFNYHQHTYRCGHADLNMTDEGYVQQYVKMGFKKIAFTDHCPEKNEIDKRQNMRMKYSERNEYLESIRKLRDKYSDKIKIESGYEVEYLPGEENNLKELKEKVDKIILGQHFIYDDDNNLKIIDFNGIIKLTDNDIIKYANYINKSMEIGIPNIIAHPDLFMLARDGFGEIEKKATNIICKSAEKYNIALEINLNNIFKIVYYENKKLNILPIEEQRKQLKKVIYPCREFWEIASNYNIKVLYGLDVHFDGQIELFKELFQFANEIIGSKTINKLNFIEKDI